MFSLSILGCFFILGCRKDEEIVTYRISKEAAAPAMPTLPGMAPAATTTDVTWTVPSGWIEQAPSTMRVGSFLIQGPDGQTADVSVVPLSGEAGGDLANINRWRGQISLPPLSESDLAGESQIITPDGRRMRLVDFVSADAAHPKRVLAAIHQHGSTSWFFKMIGDAALVETSKPVFLQFLESLHFKSHA